MPSISLQRKKNCAFTQIINKTEDILIFYYHAEFYHQLQLKIEIFSTLKLFEHEHVLTYSNHIMITQTDAFSRYPKEDFVFSLILNNEQIDFVKNSI